MRAEFCIFESNAPGLKANFYEPYVDMPSRGRCFDRGGGGGVSYFTTIEGRSQTSVFFRSPLDQKEAIGVFFRPKDPLRRLQSRAELG